MNAFAWHPLMLVMIGGALGAAGRYWLGGALLRAFGSGMPWGTLVANMLGSFAVGFIAVWLEGREFASAWRAFLIIGLLGAMTTYSALMLELLLMARAQRSGVAFAYLSLSLLGGLLLVWAGAELAARLRDLS